jgi:dipeptidase
VTKGASADGSTMITYNADAGGFMEPLYFQAAKDYQPGDSVDIYDWDSGKYLGKIKQVAHTYSVIGSMNEYQVSIGETTYGGRPELRDTLGKVDYGSLMWLALHRAKTAREAIKIMAEIVNEYGYYSSGESFSVADPNEVWIMDFIGKGTGNKGAVWVALRVPDGYISGHANQARIMNFPLKDPENCMYAPDVIDFAISKGYYNPKDGEFSFQAAYAPAEPGGLLFCEGRVWSMFRRAAPSQNLSPDYFRAVKSADPYPLWIKPDKKLTVQDAISLIRDHFEGTEYDMTKGIAAGPFGNPYRWKGLTFHVEGDSTEYGWERPISTQQTAFSFVSQMRSYLPREVGGCFWYGVDDNYSTVYMPLYCSMTSAPKSYTTGSIKEFSFESAFWIFNLVANLAYNKYSYVIKDIQVVQSELENNFFQNQPSIEKAALDLYKADPKLTVNFLTNYSLGQAEMVMKRWKDLWMNLVVKYNDGYINDVTKNNGRSPKGVGYGDKFFKDVLNERPGYYDVKWREKEPKAIPGSR